MTVVVAILTLAAFLLLFAGVGMAIKHHNPFWVLPWWIGAGLVEALAAFLIRDHLLGWTLVIICASALVLWALVIVIAAHVVQQRQQPPPDPPEGS